MYWFYYDEMYFFVMYFLQTTFSIDIRCQCSVIEFCIIGTLKKVYFLVFSHFSLFINLSVFSEFSV